MQVLLVYLDLHYVFKLNVSIVELHVLTQDEKCILMKSVLWSNKWFKSDFILFFCYKCETHGSHCSVFHL